MRKVLCIISIIVILLTMSVSVFAVLLEKVFDIPARIMESYDATLRAKYIIADGTYEKPYHTYRLRYVNEQPKKL